MALAVAYQNNIYLLWRCILSTPLASPFLASRQIRVDGGRGIQTDKSEMVILGTSHQLRAAANFHADDRRGRQPAVLTDDIGAVIVPQRHAPLSATNETAPIIRRTANYRPTHS